jgi:hypothetical protein
MEMEIKHVNFFDGQFLKQGEFIDEQAYHIHMRRRLYLVLFESDGVIEMKPPDPPTDLKIEAFGPVADKTFRVKAGMAIGLDQAAMERKELILRQDQNFDLDTMGLPGGATTAWIAIHYEEKGSSQANFPNATGFTRMGEEAVITAHSADPTGTAAANGQPFIVLGAFTIATMAVDPNVKKQVARLRGSLIAATPQINISPNSIAGSGNNIDLLVTASGGLDLSGAVNVALSSMQGVNNITVLNQTTATMTVRLSLTNAAAGPRTLTVTAGAISASATLTIQAGARLQGFAGIDQPGNDLDFKINGSGFTAPVNVAFTTSAGFSGFFPIPNANVTATQIRIPSDPTAAAGSNANVFPANAIVGPIRVQVGNPAVTLDSSVPGDVSGAPFNITPPPVISPANVSPSQNGFFTINGSRFFSGTVVQVTLPGPVVHNLLTPQPGETLSATQIKVAVDGNGLSARLLVTTDGGTVRSSNSVTNN